MAKIPNIVCTGMLDTKKEEIQYLAEKVREFGGRPVILDLSLGNEADWADIKVGEVLAIIGKAKEEMFAVSRSAAVEMIGPAAHAKILEMYKDGLVDGIISWAGSMGTSAVTYAMRALPLGVPKVMLCTGAARDVSKWLGVKDIYITNPISEKGINRITRKTVRNAVAAVVAMGKLEDEDVQDNPLAAVTLYGTTTPTAIDCAGHLDKKGFDTLYFHQTGIGALMEELIRQGQIKFVLDITPGEISRHNYFPSSKLAPGERFTAAFDTGVPNISAPGGLDQIPTSIAPQNIPKDMLEGYVSGERISYRDTKKPYAHNMSTTIVAPTLQENRDMALEIIRKLNTAKGPSVFLMPMQGWSAYDQTAAHAAVSRRMGWMAGDDGPVWIADEANPAWSRRAADMWQVLEENWDRGNPHIDIIQLDMHILDEAFSRLVCTIIDDMLAGAWKPGLYRQMEDVLK